MALSKPLSVRERKVLKRYAETGSMVEAGKQLKVERSNNASAVSAITMIGRSNVTSRLQLIFDSIGMGEEQIAQLLVAKTKARKKTYFQHEGTVTDTRVDPDEHLQLKALELVADLRGMKISKSANLNVSGSLDDLNNLRNDELQYLIEQCEKRIQLLEAEQHTEEIAVV
jgi:hypothetical protein